MKSVWVRSGQDRLAADQIEIMISEWLRVSQLQQSDLQSLESLQSQIPINKLASCSLRVLVQKIFHFSGRSMRSQSSTCQTACCVWILVSGYTTTLSKLNTAKNLPTYFAIYHPPGCNLRWRELVVEVAASLFFCWILLSRELFQNLNINTNCLL